MGVKDAHIKKFPRVLFISSDTNDVISSEINIETPNKLERSFLVTIFGKDYKGQVLPKLTDNHSKRRLLREANNRINEKLKRYIPISLGLEVLLEIENNENGVFLLISILDRLGGDTPISYRGEGLRKILTLFVRLNILNLADSEYLMILLDEPENSLHADAQHLLRSVLEQLGKEPNIQVIYSTHSPSMINNIFPERIRLLERKTINDIPTTRVIRNASADNFYAVRIRLGTTPSDSLLYAPITVILEGKTEAQNLGYLFFRLGREKSDKYPRIGQIVSQIHFLDGEGSKFAKWIPMAQSQGSIPIVLLDGDKLAEAKNAEEKYEVSVLTFDKGKEFEDIVPQDIYFVALSKVCDNPNLNKFTFDSWMANNVKFENQVITWKVSKWLETEFPDTYYDKQATMREALELTKSLDDIDTSKIEELIEVIWVKLIEYAT